MTFTELATEMLVDSGMFPKDTADVIQAMKADKVNEVMSSR